jgi:hypothetical protein
MTKPINNQEITEWEAKYANQRRKFESFLKEKQGLINDEVVNAIWINNYGDIPPIRPNKLYQCNIIDNDIKMTMTVVQNRQADSYDILDLKHLYISSIDTSKLIIVNSDDEVTFNPIEGLSSYPLNYEDSNWLSNLHIESILNRLSIKLNTHNVSNIRDKTEKEKITVLNIDGVIKTYSDTTIEEPVTPLAFIDNLDSIETTQFGFTDETFKIKLYTAIANKFKEIEDILE